MLGEFFDSADDFSKKCIEEGRRYGVMYSKSFSVSTNQYYMRCEYYNKVDKFSKNRHFCKSLIYAAYCAVKPNQLKVKKILTEHNHELYTKEEIDFKSKNKIISIPDNIQNEAYNLFIAGFTCGEIYQVIKEREFKDRECPFDYQPLKNYLYERLIKDQTKYNSFEEVYDAIINKGKDD